MGHQFFVSGGPGREKNQDFISGLVALFVDGSRSHGANVIHVIRQQSRATVVCICSRTGGGDVKVVKLQVQRRRQRQRQRRGWQSLYQPKDPCFVRTWYESHEGNGQLLGRFLNGRKHFVVLDFLGTTVFRAVF